jgi:hypothetical protein
MPATVNVNFRTVVHASSNGLAMAFPDVCNTPSPMGPIPIPYPNIAMSSDTSQGSTDVKMDKNPVMLKGSAFAQSTGDEAGAAGGLMSGMIKGKAEFQLYSFDVKVEGKNVCRMADMMRQNSKNTPPFPEIQPPCIALVLPDLTLPEQQAKQKDVKVVSLEEAP